MLSTHRHPGGAGPRSIPPALPHGVRHRGRGTQPQDVASKGAREQARFWGIPFQGLQPSTTARMLAAGRDMLENPGFIFHLKAVLSLEGTASSSPGCGDLAPSALVVPKKTGKKTKINHTGITSVLPEEAAG